ncbi:hypothetical protein K443DRAFT_72397, partial [Laccaria amethystina LaAM-08-1]
MSNAARFNAGRNPDGSFRPSKRRKIGAYHDRLVLDDDLDVIHSRATQFNTSRRLVSETPRAAQTGQSAWVASGSWAPEDNNEVGLDPGSEWYDEAMEGDVMEERMSPENNKMKEKKRSRLSKRPHIIWKERYRTEYLDEFLRGEGRGDFRREMSCPDCLTRGIVIPGSPDHRCADCFFPDLVCGSCCARRHRQLPFHRIQKWNGTFFGVVTLKSLGLRIQLNHTRSPCKNAEPCHADLRVLHTNGVHDVAFDYCGCERALPKHIQLLRRGLYPASQKIPKTCASFSLLQLLHLLALTTKGSTYDFYRTLEKLTSNTGLNVPKSRYRPLLRVVLQFRHLKMLKRGGVCHDPAGVAGVKPGSLGLSCPHCPRPGINLPEGWEKSPDSLKFLYNLIYSMDANFRLKNQLVSSFSSDPGLGIGMAYMVPCEGYDAYVLSRASDEDISTCVGFQALAKANSKFSRGLRFTGVGAVSCARSEMVLPSCVGNLQKGERYANMDYIFGTAIRNTSPNTPVVISYDIACQWFTNLRTRMNSHWPKELLPASPLEMRPQIPAFHEPGHGQVGHQEYSFKLSLGMGLTDGEGCERIWAANNALGNATKTQGPGSRQDVIDDHFGFWNWLKYCGMGKALMKKYTTAIRQRNVQAEGHRGFTNTLPKELALEWEKMCEEWDRAMYPKQAGNPFLTRGL